MRDECYRALRLHACGMCRSLPLACAGTPELDGMLLLSIVMVVRAELDQTKPDRSCSVQTSAGPP